MDHPAGASVSHRGRPHRGSGRGVAAAKLVVAANSDSAPSRVSASAQASKARWEWRSFSIFKWTLPWTAAPLTEEERRRLLESTEGLVLLRGKWVEVDSMQLRQALDHWQQLEREHAQGIGFIEGMRLLAGARLDAGDGRHRAAGRLVARQRRGLVAANARSAPPSGNHRGVPARRRSARDLAPLPGRRRALALVHDGVGPGRLPRRRHGAGQNDSGDRPLADTQASSCASGRKASGAVPAC